MLLSGDVAVYMEIFRKIYSAVFESINYKQTNKHTNIFLFYRYRYTISWTYIDNSFWGGKMPTRDSFCGISDNSVEKCG